MAGQLLRRFAPDAGQLSGRRQIAQSPALSAIPVTRVAAPVCVDRDARTEIQYQRARFIGAQALDAEVRVALVDLRFRVMISIAIADLEQRQRWMHREQEVSCR